MSSVITSSIALVVVTGVRIQSPATSVLVVDVTFTCCPKLAVDTDGTPLGK